MGMGQRILALAGEMAPAHDRAFDILREMAREVRWCLVVICRLSSIVAWGLPLSLSL